jgi:hypothetical protein
MCYYITALFCRLCARYDCQLHNDNDKVPVRDNTQLILRAQVKPWQSLNPKCRFIDEVNVEKYAELIAERLTKQIAEIKAAAPAAVGAAANDSSSSSGSSNSNGNSRKATTTDATKVSGTKEIEYDENEVKLQHSAKELQNTMCSRIILARLHMIFNSNLAAISLATGMTVHQVTALTV